MHRHGSMHQNGFQSQPAHMPANASFMALSMMHDIVMWSSGNTLARKFP
jgi:hypothetical protein